MDLCNAVSRAEGKHRKHGLHCLSNQEDKEWVLLDFFRCNFTNLLLVNYLQNSFSSAQYLLDVYLPVDPQLHLRASAFVIELHDWSLKLFHNFFQLTE